MPTFFSPMERLLAVFAWVSFEPFVTLLDAAFAFEICFAFLDLPAESLPFPDCFLPPALAAEPFFFLSAAAFFFLSAAAFFFLSAAAFFFLSLAFYLIFF